MRLPRFEKDTCKDMTRDQLRSHHNTLLKSIEQDSVDLHAAVRIPSIANRLERGIPASDGEKSLLKEFYLKVDFGVSADQENHELDQTLQGRPNQRVISNLRGTALNVKESVKSDLEAECLVGKIVNEWDLSLSGLPLTYPQNTGGFNSIASSVSEDCEPYLLTHLMELCPYLADLFPQFYPLIIILVNISRFLFYFQGFAFYFALFKIINFMDIRKNLKKIHDKLNLIYNDKFKSNTRSIVPPYFSLSNVKHYSSKGLRFVSKIRKRCKSTTLTPTLNLFNEKSKKHGTDKKQIDKEKDEKPREISKANRNSAGKPKYYAPAHIEWFNSIYTYNINTIKLLPAALKVTFKLVKSYFNLYNRKLERKIRSRRLRLRARRLSTNRMLISRPQLKHTNDKVTAIIYVYNRQKRYYLNKINRIASIDNVDNLLDYDIKEDIIEMNGSWPSNLKLGTIRKKSRIMISKVKNHKNIASKMLDISKTSERAGKIFNNYEIKYLKDYVSKCLRREIFSIYFRQSILFNKSKFEERCLSPLTKLVKRVYNKQVEFNLVNLKYLHLNSSIFSETLVTKLRNRKNRLLTVLRTSLLRFRLPIMDRVAVYDEIYNRKRRLQNPRIEYIISDSLNIQLDGGNDPESENEDIIDLSLSKIGFNDFLTKLRQFRSCWAHSITNFDYPLYMANTIIKLIKYKYASGIRIEVAGRLTRRNTAARSLFKLRYIGNIRNMDSSYKGLPSVLLRGYAKSNVQYSNLKSRIRIGSFGLKGWVSSS